jgi:antitoxin VapB
MALKIEHPGAEELARELAKRTGESVDEAVVTAIRERLDRESVYPISRTSDTIRDPVVEEIRERMLRKPRPDPESTRVAIREIQTSLAKLPILDSRTAKEILGYDEFGLTHKW